MQTVSIIIPHLPNKGREQGLYRCLDSIRRLSYPQDKIEVLIMDDPALTVPKKVNDGYKRSTGQILAYAATDMEFTPDSLSQAVNALETQGKRLVSFNPGVPILPDEGNICEHMIISRTLADEFGEIFSEDFFHLGCDNFLWARAKKLNEAYYCEQAKVIHHHFSHGKPMDEVHKIGWSRVAEDRAMLAKKLALLHT